MADASDRDPHLLDDALWAQAVRLVAGECTPDEGTSLRAWFDADPARRAVLDEATAAWHETARVVEGATMPVWDADRALASMLPRLQAVRRTAGDDHVRDGARTVARTGASRAATTHAWRPRLVAAAAVAVAVIGTGLAWRAIAREGVTTGTGLAVAAPVRTERAAPATPRRLVLDDGTKVVLTPGSVLRLAAGYGDAHRDIELEGEGRFTVAARSGAPRVRVLARGVTVEDVSTAFVVRVSPTDVPPRVQVGVLSGRVILHAAGDATLDAGMVAEADSAAAPRALDGGILASLSAGSDGRLVFVDAALDEVAARVARWHGVTVTLGAGVPRDRRVTATFTGETPRQLLDAVAASAGLTVRDESGRFTLVAAAAR